MARNPSHFPGQDEFPIFEDQENYFHSTPPMASHNVFAHMNLAPNGSLAFAPQLAPGAPQSHSPQKKHSQHQTRPHPPYQNQMPLNSTSISRFNQLPNQVIMSQPHANPRTTDSLQKKPFLSNFKTATQRPTLDHGAMFGKENFLPPGAAAVMPSPTLPRPPLAPVSSQLQAKPLGKPLAKPPMKRAHSDSSSQPKEARPAKKAKVEDSEEEIEIPAYNEFPPIIDDGTKPGHSYAMLIGMAILRHPHRRLTLSQIYKWISDTYSFYGAQDAGWQNSIRHNLSLHKAFHKTERPKDDPGKGNYWRILPGMEKPFLKDKAMRKVTPDTVPVMSTRMNPPNPQAQNMMQPFPVNAPKSVPMTASFSLPPNPMPPTMHHPQYHQHNPTPMPPLPPPAVSMPPSSAPAPTANHALPPPLPESCAAASVAPDLSSDATIPISDAGPDDVLDSKQPESDAAVPESSYSPFPPAMDSSPPIPRHHDVHQGTPPPPLNRGVLSSISRSRGRDFADDSGYISSLESSIMRQKPTLTSDTERRRIKRGRAEEEIARLRASSCESPSKGRSLGGYVPQSSSPLRKTPARKMLPPLTPAMKIKETARPPPSVSPNTNLRIHRDRVQSMLQSPLRRMTDLFEVSTPWKPTFGTMEEPLFGGNDGFVNGADFDIYTDFNEMFNSAADAAHSSPLKKRGSQGEQDQTGTSAHYTTKTDAPVPSVRLWESAGVLETPSRFFDGMSSPLGLVAGSPVPIGSPSKMVQGPTSAPNNPDWSAFAFDTPDFFAAAEDEGGVDISRGFERIGSGRRTIAGTKAGQSTSGGIKPKRI